MVSLGLSSCLSLSVWLSVCHGLPVRMPICTWNLSRDKKKARNLEGLISIRGELITEAANYNPLDVPCRSLQPDVLQLSRQLTDDLLILISAPRWHMLSWVMAWPELHTKCADLLKDPTLRDPIEDLKYLNIDYTQFNGWSSDEEVTIFTGNLTNEEKDRPLSFPFFFIFLSLSISLFLYLSIPLTLCLYLSFYILLIFFIYLCLHLSFSNSPSSPWRSLYLHITCQVPTNRQKWILSHYLLLSL